MPANTYFNAGALENLRDVDCRAAVVVPDEATILRGIELLDRTRPDLVLAVGGGSVIDAAKAMRLFHEHPERTMDDLTLPFLDPRKRVADYPREPHTVQLIAIPTTSGTGSEVSPAAVTRSPTPSSSCRPRATPPTSPDKYAQLGRVVFGGREPEESRRRLFAGVTELLDRLGMPRSLKDIGAPRTPSSRLCRSWR